MPSYTPSPKVIASLAEPLEFPLKGRTFSLAVIPTSYYAQSSRNVAQNPQEYLEYCETQARRAQRPFNEGEIAAAMVKWKYIQQTITDKDRTDIFAAQLRALIGDAAYDELAPFDGREAIPLLKWVNEQLSAGFEEDEEKNA
jgi:hypothetical protein